MSVFDLAGFAAREGLPADFGAQVARLHAPLAARIAALAEQRPGLLVVGLCAPQGSGKSTAVAVLAGLLAARGLACAVLSLDDLYLTRAQRQALARDVHPLLATRGPPGTHDVALGMAVIAALAAGAPARLPRFDKSADDRLPDSAWPLAPANCRVLLFEGWCVGARPEPAAALAAPLNRLEAEEDAEGRWRAYVNAALAGPCRALFDRPDLLVQMRAPDFATVTRWRLEQEAKLRARAPAMDEGEVRRFVQFFERTTRQIDAEMPPRADIVLTLGPDRQLLGWQDRPPR